MRLTVFTPTFNRKELLRRAYHSLTEQTVKDFEWLIVDDGSTDGTDEEVRKWIDEALIPIRYYYRSNGGKMRAHNTGVFIARTELFVCLDSDDRFTESAVEDLLGAYDSAKSTAAPGTVVGGVVAHKGNTDENIFGGVDFPDVSVSTLYGLYRAGFSGETTLMYETQLLRRFPFPEIEGEKYVPEDYIYDKIDGICVLAVLHKIVTVCEIVKSGYTDSAKKLKRENVNAFYLFYEQRAFITPWGLLKFKYLGRYVIYAYRSSRPVFSGSRLGVFPILCGYVYGGFLLLTHRE
ncbi:MAG: glycosyltransferase family 2 protein [Lachnospiraceae bacterium]|nr:glycosyltransferase family 2 protein [Lachnospiraceae bacterium]